MRELKLITVVTKPFTQSRRAPYGVRELKLIFRFERFALGLSRPLRGARIETPDGYYLIRA